MIKQKTHELFKQKTLGLIRNYPKILLKEYVDCTQSIVMLFTAIYSIWKNLMQFLSVLCLPFFAPLVILFMYYKCWRSVVNDFNKNNSHAYNKEYTKHG